MLSSFMFVTLRPSQLSWRARQQIKKRREGQVIGTGEDVEQVVEFVVKTVDPLVEGGMITAWEDGDGDRIVIWWRALQKLWDLILLWVSMNGCEVKCFFSCWQSFL